MPDETFAEALRDLINRFWSHTPEHEINHALANANDPVAIEAIKEAKAAQAIAAPAPEQQPAPQLPQPVDDAARADTHVETEQPAQV